ncbi:MAG: hypothetical protein IJ504_00760 [Bacteroidales bacterium]|nr:hypothetical protein [Bacteroidales bacterium]
MNYKELINKWGDCPDRQKMTARQEREYVDDWYQTGTSLPTKPYSPLSSEDKDYEGQEFEVVGILTEEEADLECLPIWKIRMKDERILEAVCDEIFQFD